MLEPEKELYQKIISLTDDNRVYADAIAFLSRCLAKYHKQKVIILIDEYDIPLENAYFAGFYQEMMAFVCSLTESSCIIKELIENANDVMKAELEDLMSQKTIVKQFHEDITYENISSSPDNLWNFLLLTGYLKIVDSHFDGMKAYIKMAIPNMEVRYIYERNITEWFNRRSKATDLTDMYRAMLNRDEITFENSMKNYLKRSISFYDERKRFIMVL